jgi:hypothetical protein
MTDPMHRNFGPYQVVLWPRWRFVFWRGEGRVYRWIFYVWPFELRRFLR